MFSNKRTWLAISIVIAVMAFWAGTEVQKIRYDDLCLDLGGGRNPGDYPICVVERLDDAFWIGPIRVTSREVVGIAREEGAQERVRIRLTLNPHTAKALRDYTEQSLGQELELRIGNRVVRSVRIAEPLRGAEFVIVSLSEVEADRLKTLLSPNER